MRELRRQDRGIDEDEAMAQLSKAEYGVLSTVSAKYEPYGVPLNFCVVDDCIYFHCAVEGQKIDNITRNKSVSFCTVGTTEILPEKFSTKYESVIVSGDAEEVFGRDKQIALEGLVHKYSPEFIDEGLKYIDDFRDTTRVFKIRISKLTGKARNK